MVKLDIVFLCADILWHVSLLVASFYNSFDSFTCFDGLKTIKFQHINDNYCDCQDGSDEPGEEDGGGFSSNLMMLFCLQAGGGQQLGKEKFGATRKLLALKCMQKCK